MATRERILEVLKSTPWPGFRRDVLSLGGVEDVAVDETGRARVRVRPGVGGPQAQERLVDAVRRAVAGIEGVREVEIVVGSPDAGRSALHVVSGAGAPAAAKGSPAAGGALDDRLLPGVRHVVAVASGKGGVGKSTVAVNLAVALARSGLSVGLLDADIYGPSIPILFGLAGTEPSLDRATRHLIPFEKYGVRFMSLGFLVPADSAVIWRGPMVMKALEQLMRDVEWGELDVLVVDMPPGTGDAQLTMSQRIRLSGAVIVTTPQDLALADAIKGVAMFRKVGVDILGVVENMSHFVCAHCGERNDVFGHGGGRQEAGRLGVPFLGEVPLHASLRESGDRGHPIVDAEPNSPPAEALLQVARGVARALVPENAERAETTGERAGGLFERFRRAWGPASPNSERG